MSIYTVRKLPERSLFAVVVAAANQPSAIIQFVHGWAGDDVEFRSSFFSLPDVPEKEPAIVDILGHEFEVQAVPEETAVIL